MLLYVFSCWCLCCVLCFVCFLDVVCAVRSAAVRLPSWCRVLSFGRVVCLCAGVVFGLCVVFHVSWLLVLVVVCYVRLLFGCLVVSVDLCWVSGLVVVLCVCVSSLWAFVFGCRHGVRPWFCVFYCFLLRACGLCSGYAGRGLGRVV